MNYLNSEKKELLIIGIPRSGSTLLSALVDSLEDSMCISEPQKLFIRRDYPTEDRDLYIQSIFDSLKEYREDILNGKMIKDRRNSDGTPTTNYQVRSMFLKWTLSRFKPPQGFIDTSKYSSNALIAIKHNVPFFAVLPQLIESEVSIIGIVRNPISTILSWQDTKITVSRGFLPSAQSFWPEINQIMNASKNEFVGLSRIHNAFCERLIKCGIRIIRYEDLVQNPKEIEKIMNRKFIRDIPVRNSNKNTFYDWKNESKIREYLREYAPYSCKLYPDF